MKKRKKETESTPLHQTDEDLATYSDADFKKAKKSFYKKWWFWLIVVIVIIVAGAAAGYDPDTTKTTNETEAETKSETTEASRNVEPSSTEAPPAESTKTPTTYNKTTAWWAVQDLIESKGLNKTDFSLDKVIINSDGNYEVYCTRTMVDGTTGTFKYVLKPYNPSSDGSIDQYTLVEDSGQVLE